MKKPQPLKPVPLRLRREQIRQLETKDLAEVQGGKPPNSNGVPGCHIPPLSCDC